MSKAQFAGDNRQALAGIVRCGYCKGPMLRVGPNYSCATGLSREWHPCHWNSINAVRLLEVVMDRLMALVMTPETVDSVVEIIRSHTTEASRRERQQLNHTEAALRRIRARETSLEDPDADPDLDYEEAPRQELPEDLTEELGELSNTAIALEYERRRSSRELDGLEFVGDDERLRANALNPENYRHRDYPEYTVRIVRMFIESVEVEPTALTLNFTLPIPTDDQPEGILSTDIPL